MRISYDVLIYCRFCRFTDSFLFFIIFIFIIIFFLEEDSVCDKTVEQGILESCSFSRQSVCVLTTIYFKRWLYSVYFVVIYSTCVSEDGGSFSYACTITMIHSRYYACHGNSSCPLGIQACVALINCTSHLGNYMLLDFQSISTWAKSFSLSSKIDPLNS